jgi:adenylosuccinate synthase
MRAFVVLDLGFGDAGKGLLTDFLVRRSGAKLVVRYNGGAQAAHNVVTPDGRHHTFAQLGAGSFVDGVRTFLSRHVAIHPTALLREAAALAAKGVADVLARVGVSERAVLITPFHQAANRLRELARGAARHGSCGVGVGEAVHDARQWPDEAVVARDLCDVGRLRSKLRRVCERKRAEVQALALPHEPRSAYELQVFEGDKVAEAWCLEATRLATLGCVVPDETLTTWMSGAGAVVFEGAQGVLLDEYYGFHPYTTWSNCTPANALELLAESASDAEAERVGVLRAYALRHGPGPLPSETQALSPAVREHNTFGEWQGPVRYGWFDAVLARYALEVVGGVDTLAMTHADVVPRMASWMLCAGYRIPSNAGADLVATTTAAGAVAGLTIARGSQPETANLARQERLTKLLQQATPLLEECQPTEDSMLEHVEHLLEREVDLVSRGPRALDIAARQAQRTVLGSIA